MSIWPIPIPDWFWVWARWYLGHEEFEGKQQDPTVRPKNAPATIPYWAWARLCVLLGKPIPAPPPEPPPVATDKALVKARAMLSSARGYTGPYVFGGGHGTPVAQLTKTQGLDCSSSTSELMDDFGLLGSNWPQVSDWFERWGNAGRGKYVTVHANDEHVWTEFNLPEGYFRFDTSPHGDGERGPRVRTSRRFDSTFVHRHPAGL